jgi:acetyl-CoA acetyltransferase
MMSASIPVVIGVGDIKNRSNLSEDAFEPLELMLQAIAAALKDTGISTQDAQTLQQSIDSISVVANWTWPYPNTPELLLNILGCRATYLHESDHGGNAPAELFDEAARRIASGESKVAVITGGEALASCKVSHRLNRHQIYRKVC